MSSAGFKNSDDGSSLCIGSGCLANLLPMTTFATAVTGVIGCRTIMMTCMWCAATPEARAPCSLEERQGVLDLTVSGVILYAVSSPGLYDLIL